jgi:hypothetical protein
MRGSLSEFTLAQLLQFFALAERSGTITVSSPSRESRLLVEGDRIIGWGLDDFDALAELSGCEMLPAGTTDAARSIRRRDDTPGLSFIVRNMVEPERWNAFAQRQLEQDIYPLLGIEEGEFDVVVRRCPPSPLPLSIPINSLILDGSRWESEMEAAQLDGYCLESSWMRSTNIEAVSPVNVSTAEWLTWSMLVAPATIGDVARRLCLPDLDTIGAIRRLASAQLIERDSR